jgi:O-glycosyl hydrolase
VNIFEAFSNSPPYWMTISGCASGAVNRGQDNLDPKYYDAFADYLVTVMKHLQEAEGIIFESLEPFNEPDGWWWVAGGGQEGNYAKAATQDTVLQLVQRRLQSGNHVTFVAGPDANNYDLMPQFLDRYSTDTIQALGRVNVHQYLGTRPLDLRNRIAQLQKPLWMSEVGCCFPGQTDGTEMDGAMWMARQIRVALRDMRAEAWILWQPDWNIIDFNSGHPKPMRQYFAIAQYSNFIRPGYQIISSGADNTLAAYSRADRRLVLVATNSIVSALGATGLIALQPSAVGLVNDYDLSAFVLSKQTVRVYRTTVGASMRPIAAVSKVDSLGRFTDFAPPQSITTYVFDGVDLTSSAPRNER